MNRMEAYRTKLGSSKDGASRASRASRAEEEENGRRDGGKEGLLLTYLLWIQQKSPVCSVILSAHIDPYRSAGPPM